jgi:cytosine deaminase
MMNILDNGIHLSQFASPEEVEVAFDLITYNGARCLNIHNEYGLEVGKDANFIVLDGDSPWDCIRRRVGVLASVRKGEFLFKKKPTEFEIPIVKF